MYPKLKVLPTSRQMVDVFRGYNHNLRISTGEFYDMRNLTSDLYPVLSPRKPRGIYAKPASPQALIAKEQLCYVDGADFVIGEERIAMGLSTAHGDNPKRLVSMGAYVIILPDKMYCNTIDPEDHGAIEATVTTSGEVTMTLCAGSGENYPDAVVSPTAPENPENLDLWIDSSSEPHSLKQYSKATGQWVGIVSTYVKISATGIGKGLNQYDGVTISGLTGDAEGLNGSAVLWHVEEDAIVVVGLLDKAVTQTEAVTVTRAMPNMDFVIESENRLWGCRYGTAANGEFVNEIYACKLGDFRNWSCYMNLSTDSYAASCGTDGPFTGAITHLGYPLFFKENCVHKIFGSYPANFQIQTISCRGVQKGCQDSLAIVNETLYYKSRSGICAFDGSLPSEASYALGAVEYGNAVGGAHGNKYYVSMMDDQGQWNLFVYDTAKGLWHREDNLHALAFCSHGSEMYCINADTMNIITMLGSGEALEEKVRWMAETGELGISSPDMKYISRITLRMAADVDTVIRVYAQYDMSEEWILLCDIRATSLRSFSVPIRARRCDFMRLRIVGEGHAGIYSYTKTIEQGSERS